MREREKELKSCPNGVLWGHLAHRHWLLAQGECPKRIFYFVSGQEDAGKQHQLHMYTARGGREGVAKRGDWVWYRGMNLVVVCISVGRREERSYAAGLH